MTFVTISPANIQYDRDFTNQDDDKIILEKVKNSMLRVVNGEAVYERDSVIFNEIQYSWPLLAALMWVALQSNGVLNLIDFGGSLGSTYYQNIKFLQASRKITWNIIEQRHFVDTGKKHFENEELRFYYDIESCLNESSPNTILFSSVLQYLEKPYELLNNILCLGFEIILFDRTPFVRHGPDKITVQKVPSKIYKASYPCWFFNKKNFYNIFSERYEIISTFEAKDRSNIPSTFEGGILLKK